jgi:hypothetical protein
MVVVGGDRCNVGHARYSEKVTQSYRPGLQLETALIVCRSRQQPCMSYPCAVGRRRRQISAIKNGEGLLIAPLLERWWRIVATGWVFVVFGLGALVISASVFPVLRLVSWNADTARLRIQRASSSPSRSIWLMKTLGLLSFEVQNIERLWRRAAGDCQSSTLIDVVFLVSLMPKVTASSNSCSTIPSCAGR